MTASSRTRRWNSALGLAFGLSAAGVYFEAPVLLVCTAVCVAFAAYPHLTTAPAVEVDLRRRFDPDAPSHGESVGVTVAVTNVGDRRLPDLRVVDGVPPTLSVRDGTARHAAALDPGESTEFSYDVAAKHGFHRFRPAALLARDVSGGTVVETTVETDDELVCTPVGDSTAPPSRRSVSGQVTTDAGGSGVEFHRTRAYRPGDRPSRIDWRRYARTGDLATVAYRDERSASVVYCLDARAVAYRSESPDEPHAVCYGVAAIDALGAEALADGQRVGAAVLGSEFRWLAPDAGANRRAVLRTALRAEPAVLDGPPDGAADTDDGEQLDALEARLDSRDAVVFCTPLVDDFCVAAGARLRALGHRVSVVSPDVTTTATLGGRLAALERANRVAALRRSAVPVVEWDPAEPLVRARWNA